MKWKDPFIIRKLAIFFFICIGLFWHYSSLNSSDILSKEFGKLQVNILENYTDTFKSHSFSFNAETRQLSISKDDKLILQMPVAEAFLSASTGEQILEEHRGSFFFSYKDIQNCSTQSVDRFSLERDRLSLTGQLTCGNGQLPWQMSFSENEFGDLEIHLAVDPSLKRLLLQIQSQASESFFGAGEQFTYFDLKGHNIPIWLSEQGIGRGREPLTTLVNIAARSGGTPYTTYISSGQFLSSELRGFFVRNKEYSDLDFRNPNKLVIDTWSNSLKLVIATKPSPKELLTQLSNYSGRMRQLPDWMHRGAIIGLQGGTTKVKKILEQLKGLNTPLSGVWLQDWVGQRKTSIGKQLWWNWDLNHEHYPQWTELVQSLKEKDIRVLGYINPFLADIPKDYPHKRRLKPEALAKELLVRDPNGKVLELKNTSFSAALLDLKKEETQKWMKEVIHSQLVDNGFSGWMADFGEAYPFLEYHNEYAELWAKVNREAIEELENSKDLVFFMRSGFSESPKYSTLFWAGDQMVTWDQYDGIKSALTALLSSGLSGFSLNHSDIGGYTSFDKKVLAYMRSEELLIRWMELNAFSPIFRSHEGNLPDPNPQIYSNLKLRQHFSKNAKIFSSLFEYRKKLLVEATTKGWPVVRPMWLEFFNEPEVLKNHQQFMLGDQLLVAPVLDEGADEVKVFLPKGRWQHFITGEVYEIENSKWLVVKTPLGQPAAFKKL